MSKTEQAISWMEKMANDNSHGYDQIYRWGEKGDYDCSAAVITAWQTAGVPVKTNGATYTGNMYRAFIKSGFTDVTGQINKTTGEGLVRGDVLLNDTSHTAMYCGSKKLVQASINEKGTVSGGTPGDQTGREFWIRSYYNYPWTHILRYNESFGTTGVKTSVTDAAKAVIAGKYGNGADRVAKLKAAGYDPDTVQKKVNELLSGTAQSIDYTAIARDVIAGKYGNGAARKKALEAKGYSYSKVQAEVNRLLK